MTAGHLLKVGLASLALLAVPAGIDTRALIVDGTGAAMGTATNPLVTSGSGTAPAAITDATANPTTGTVQNFPMVWNGTTWDRWKDMGAANAITNFAGVPAVAPMYLDTTGTPSVRRGVTAASTTGGITGIQVPGSGNLVWDATSFRPQLADTAGRTQVVGAAADNATAVGNPVLMGIQDAGGNARTVRGAIIDGLSVSQTMSAGMMALNGASEDRVRNNVSSSIHASAATGTGTVNTDVVNYNARFFTVHVNVTNFNGGTVLTKLQQQDANSIFTDIPGATTGAVATPNTDIFLTVGPNTWPANTAANFYANFSLPRQIRIVTTVAAATVTFSNAYEMGGGY